MSHLALVLAVLVLAFEFQNVVSWWRGRVLRTTAARSPDFTIVVPLFGHPQYFAGRARLETYRERVLVAMEVTPVVMKEFADELEAEGWRVKRLELTDPNPARLVAAALPHVETSYVLRLDADTVAGDELPVAVAALDADGADLASTKVAVLSAPGLCTRIQELEYRIAMLTRHYRPWLTSGACFIARTSALRAIFAHHSGWTPGEDIETGRVAVALGMRIRHADLTVYTEAPGTWLALFRQRRLWWAGNFRHAVINLDRNVFQMPVMTCYWMLMIWMALLFEPWHAMELREVPSTLPMLYIAYLLVTVIPNLRVASPWMLVFPLFAFVQSLVMPAAGAVQYAVLARRTGALGRYRFPILRQRTTAVGAPACARASES